MQTSITSSGLKTEISLPTRLPNGKVNYAITGGTRPSNGPNLFHSFGAFSIAEEGIATFTNTTSSFATTNILSRVTGGAASQIYGTIDTLSYPGANLFLINPAGVVFGPNATLNVGGSVNVSTADYLKLKDGVGFNAIPGAADALLSVAPVTAFGFLGPASGKITINQSTLTVPEGKTLALVGGDIRMDGGTLATNGGPIELSASTVRLENRATMQSTATDTGSAGTITIQGFEGKGSAATNVSLDNGTVSTTLSGGSAATTPATITFMADKMTVGNGARITTDTHGPAPAGDITFNVGTLTAKGGPNRISLLSAVTDPASKDAKSNVTLKNTGVLIESTSSSPQAEAGHAGQITIQGITGPGSAARTISLDDTMIATRIAGGTAATNPATMAMTADSVVLSNNAVMKATSLGTGPAGNIALHVGTLRANVRPDGTRITGPERRVFLQSASTSLGSTASPAGNVTISGIGPGATDAATLVALHNTSVTTEVLGGTAATAPSAITITADTVTLTGTEAPVLVGTNLAATSAGATPAGNIALHVGTLRVNENPVNENPDETRIRSAEGGRAVWLQSPNTSSERTAGPAGTVTISGPGPEPTDAATLVALSNMRISTRVSGGNADTAPSRITIRANTLTSSATTDVAARSDGAAPAGNIALHVDTLRTNTVDPTPTDTVTFSSSSGSSDSTAGPAGTVTISGPAPEATDAATLVALHNARISTRVSGGKADTAASAITITTDTLDLSNEIRELVPPGIFATSSGPAPAGSVSLNVAILSTNRAIQNVISSSTDSGVSNAGHAGSVAIQGVAGAGSLPTAVTLYRTNITTEAKTGAGGAITLASATDINLVASTISTTVSGGSKPGGNITLSAGDHISLADGSTISAQSRGLGNAGSIALAAGTGVLTTDSAVTTQASQASGGNISVFANDMVRLKNSQLNASVAGNEQTVGGTIFIDPQSVILQNSQIAANATAGRGGNINIITSAFLADPQSIVSASSDTGISGSVDIRAPVQNLSGTLVPLTQSYLRAAGLLAQRCAARSPDGKFSTFVQVGREGRPVEPGGFLATPLYMATRDTTDNTGEGIAAPHLGRDPIRTLAGNRGCAY